MPISESLSAFDVIVVPFPYSDRLAEKRRPALVISGPQLARFELVWVAMITSADNNSWTCDVPIGDLKLAGLPAASVVRPAKIACIEPERVLRKAGRLERAAVQMVLDRLNEFLPSQ